MKNMNYTMETLPDSGNNPAIFMDIAVRGQHIGRIYIKLYRDIFPAGVENFIAIASGKTYRNIPKGTGKYKYIKHVKRWYGGCKFFSILHNNYIISGDVFRNNGTDAGTMFSDEPIPEDFGEYYIPHDVKGLVSLIPYIDEDGNRFYDSTFMITLDDAKPSNTLSTLDEDQIVIGYVYNGIEVIDKLNQLIKPYAGRSYPNITIEKSDVYNPNETSRRIRPISRKRTLN